MAKAEKLIKRDARLIMEDLEEFAGIIADNIGDNYADLHPTPYIKSLMEFYGHLRSAIDTLTDIINNWE